jgi:hypothetical protein
VHQAWREPTCIMVPTAAPPAAAAGRETRDMDGWADMTGCTAMEAAASIAGLSATMCEESRADAAGRPPLLEAFELLLAAELGREAPACPPLWPELLAAERGCWRSWLSAGSGVAEAMRAAAPAPAASAPAVRAPLEADRDSLSWSARATPAGSRWN